MGDSGGNQRGCVICRMKNGRFTRPLRLSRNYSFADKQERTVGRSKVVQKFLPMVETFSLYRYKNRDTCSRFYEFAVQILLNAR